MKEGEEGIAERKEKEANKEEGGEGRVAFPQHCKKNEEEVDHCLVFLSSFPPLFKIHFVTGQWGSCMRERRLISYRRVEEGRQKRAPFFLNPFCVVNEEAG
jgi:hypothetical protein